MAHTSLPHASALALLLALGCGSDPDSPPSTSPPDAGSGGSTPEAAPADSPSTSPGDSSTPANPCKLPTEIGVPAEHGLTLLYEPQEFGAFLGRIAVSGGSIYFSENHHLKRIPTTGGTADDLGDRLLTGFLILGSDIVYASGQGTAAMYKLSKAPLGADAGAATVLAENLEMVGPLVSDGTALYWANANSDGLFKVPLAGGPVSPLAATARTGGLALIGSTLYWPDFHTRHLMSLPTSGGTPMPHVEIFFGGEAAADDAAVYWADSSEGTVNRWATNTTTSEQLFSRVDVFDSPDLIAVDGGSVYFTMGFVGGGVFRVSTTGGAAESLACGFNALSGIAVDATSVYIASSEGVHRVDR